MRADESEGEVESGDAENPIVLAYLKFLDEQMTRHPELFQPMDELLASGNELVGHMEVDIGEDLGDVSFP